VQIVRWYLAITVTFVNIQNGVLAHISSFERSSWKTINPAENRMRIYRRIRDKVQNY